MPTSLTAINHTVTQNKKTGLRRPLILIVILVNITLATSVALDKKSIQAKAIEIAPQNTSEKETVRRLALFVRNEMHHLSNDEAAALPLPQRLYYFYNPFHPGPKTALDHGGHFNGSCGSSSRLLMSLLEARGIDSRFILIQGRDNKDNHTLLEVYYDKNWGAVDPLYNIIYEHPDHSPASLRELRKNSNLFLTNARTGWEYGYGADNRYRKYSYNTEKYPFSGAYYFNFNKFGEASRTVLRALLNTFGTEGVLWIKRPNFYAFPALTTAIIFDILAAIAAFTWLTRNYFLLKHTK